MIEINPADPQLMNFLKKQTLKEELKYRRSRFTLLFEVDQHSYILNTLTRQCLECKDTLDGRYTGTQISTDPVLLELMENYFLIPEEKDETIFYLNIYRLMQAMRKKKKAWLYTIFPTMDCNARCVYCFEEGEKPVRMSEETAEQVVAFIADQPHLEEISLSWFGGEPLMEPGIIDRICQGLSVRGIPFKSNLTTNGSLITEEILQKMLGTWNVQHVQVSMDGDEQSYIQRKQYLQYRDEYHKVLQAISRMAEGGIWVNLRCNVDQDNVDGAVHLIEDLSAAVSAKDKVLVCFGVLNQARYSEQDLEIWEKAVSLWDRVIAAGFKLSRYVGPYMEFRCFHCMADQGNVIIMPDGKLYPCEYYPEKACFGNVRDGVTHPQAREEFISSRNVRQKCRECAYLPECTPFATCSLRDRYCREVRELLFVTMMKGLIRKKYATRYAPDIGAFITRQD